jgi:hypothetical protein
LGGGDREDVVEVDRRGPVEQGGGDGEAERDPPLEPDQQRRLEEAVAAAEVPVDHGGGRPRPAGDGRNPQTGHPVGGELGERRLDQCVGSIGHGGTTHRGPYRRPRAVRGNRRDRPRLTRRTGVPGLGRTGSRST